MRKRLVYLSAITTVLLGGLELTYAAYVIKLKNGNEYVTSRYWHEGGQVLFDTFGGVFGVDKAFVTTIDKTDQRLRLATVTERDPAEKTRADSKQNSDSVDEKPAAANKTEPKREAEDPIAGEFNRLKAKSKEVDGMLTSEIRELLNQITAFKNKIVKDGKLFIDYGREFNDLNAIGDAVETALRARGQ